MNHLLLIFAAALASVANAGLEWTNWYVFCSKHNYGHQTHTARLMGIHGSWTAACEGASVNIRHRNEDKWTWFGQPFDRRLRRCVNKQASWNGMWGEFDVPNPECTPVYADFQDIGCDENVYGRGRRKAVLRNIPDGFSAFVASQETGATIDGVHYPKANEISESGGSIYGVFSVPDAKCTPRWEYWEDEGCHDGKRRMSAILTGFMGRVAPIESAMKTAAVIDGRHFNQPKSLKGTTTGSTTVVRGFFEYSDPKCSESVERKKQTAGTVKSTPKVASKAPQTRSDKQAASSNGGKPAAKTAPKTKADTGDDAYKFCIERDGKYLSLDTSHAVVAAKSCGKREHFQMFSVGDGKKAIRSVAFGTYLSMFPNGELKSMPHKKVREYFIKEKNGDGRLAFRSDVFGDYIGFVDGKWKGMVRRYLTIVPVNY